MSTKTTEAETTEVETEQVETPAEETETPASTEGEETPAATEEKPAEEYVPNFKYNARNVQDPSKKEEKEFDERLKSIVKTKEDEDFVRELMTRHDGIEVQKANLKATEEKFSQLNTWVDNEVAPYIKNVEGLKSLISSPEFEKRDYAAFFEKLGIPQEHILRYTKGIIDYQEMDPAQRAIIDHNRRVQAQLREQEEQSQLFQSQSQQMAVQARTMELNLELTKPNVSSFVTAFDELHGQGAFRTQVINTGAQIFYSQKRDASPSELVGLVMSQFKGIGAPAPQTAPTKPVVQAPGAKKPVIPTVQGTGGSPAKPMFTSIQQLREHKKKISQS